MSISFEVVSEDSLYIAKEMVTSNHEHWENTSGELAEPLSNIGNGKSLFLKLDETYIGLVKYVKDNESVMVKLLLIHPDYQGYGFGTQAFFALEQRWKSEGVQSLRVQEQKNQSRVNKFWEHVGFRIDDMMKDERVYVKKDL
ncbi:GNAT family N-acetyltransferase [Bacillus spongiae]|uniref:GNAT family N-acetyltransferase n=1 Tax=Bacillus spongiae TaxID=2683610 RepID=A0ABU8HGD4_9BACI